MSIINYSILFFQENCSYSLWVTAFDGFIPQRTEVVATITNNVGERPIPHPPPFLPTYPNIAIPQPKPLPPSTTKVTANLVEDVTVPEITTTTTLNPPKRPDDVPQNNLVTREETNRVNNSDTVEETPPPGNDVPLAIIPAIAIGGLVVIVAAVIVFVWKKNNSTKTKPKKDDMVSYLTSFLFQRSMALSHSAVTG